MLVIGLAFILFAVWYDKNSKDDSTTTSSTGKNYNIYLITMDKTDQFWHIVNQGTADMAELLGITYTWDAPDKRIVEEQINIFNNAVNNGADAIILAASDPEKISSAVEAAKEKGVKIIYVDAPANVEGIITLATDNYSAGMVAGKIMISELIANGVRQGSIGIVGVTPENATTINRERGFRDVIETDGRFTLLDTRYVRTDIGSEQAAEGFIEDNSDLVGLFGTNEGTTIGVGSAIEASNKNIIGIGFDLTDTIKNMIREGSLQAVIMQNPYTMGYLGMAETFAALNGYDTGPTNIDTGVSEVTRANLPFIK